MNTRTHEDICRNNHKGNPESEAAHLSTNKSRDSQRILKALRENPRGLTSDQLTELLGMPHQTCSARCAELKEQGIIKRKPKIGGRYWTRPTRTGNQAAVLILQQNG